MLQRPTLTPPTVAYVTVVLTTLTAIDLGQGESNRHGSASGRCYHLHSCVHHLSEYERLIAGGNISFSDSALADACGKHYDIRECVRRAWSTCVPNNANAADGIVRWWRGINSSLSYLCNHAKKEFLQYNKACYTRTGVQSAIHECNRTYHMHKDVYVQTNDELCRLTKTLLRCLYDSAVDPCGDEAVRLLSTTVRLLRQPEMERYDCHLGGSRVTWYPTVLLISGLLSRHVAAAG